MPGAVFGGDPTCIAHAPTNQTPLGPLEAPYAPCSVPQHPVAVAPATESRVPPAVTGPPTPSCPRPRPGVGGRFVSGEGSSVQTQRDPDVSPSPRVRPSDRLRAGDHFGRIEPHPKLQRFLLPL